MMALSHTKTVRKDPVFSQKRSGKPQRATLGSVDRKVAQTYFSVALEVVQRFRHITSVTYDLQSSFFLRPGAGHMLTQHQKRDGEHHFFLWFSDPAALGKGNARQGHHIGTTQGCRLAAFIAFLSC